MNADLRADLAALAEGRDMSPEARTELARLLAGGTDAELRDVIGHLRHLPIVRSEDVDVCPETTALVAERWPADEAREAAHRHRIGATAYRIGTEVGAHRLTLDDAERRLFALVNARNPECPVPVRIVPYDEAEATMRDAFARGMRKAAS